MLRAQHTSAFFNDTFSSSNTKSNKTGGYRYEYKDVLFPV